MSEPGLRTPREEPAWSLTCMEADLAGVLALIDQVAANMSPREPGVAGREAHGRPFLRARNSWGQGAYDVRKPGSNNTLLTSTDR